MPKPQPTVEVVPNPYSALDADGVPQGAVGLPGTRHFIGAEIDLQLSQKEGKTRFFFPGFPERKFKVPLDTMVANAINEGSLIAFTKECARKVGIGEKEFGDVAKILESEKARALADYQAAYGKEATLGAVPTERKPTEPADAPAAVALSGPKGNPNLVAPQAPTKES